MYDLLTEFETGIVAAESAQQREARLARRRVRDRAHCALRSAAQRERVLDHRRGRLASETPDQRTSRLERMSFVQQRRLTTLSLFWSL